jgi:PIN domain nuclease of toxin-antitoxin system
LKLLLDTHIWVWALVAINNLSRRVRAEIASPKNELWLSPISVWEVMLLCEKGRLLANEDSHAWVSRALRSIPTIEAPLTHEVAIESRRIALPHDDPADRFLAATAKVFGLTLVTADTRLLGCRGIKVLGNR